MICSDYVKALTVGIFYTVVCKNYKYLINNIRLKKNAFTR